MPYLYRWLVVTRAPTRGGAGGGNAPELHVLGGSGSGSSDVLGAPFFYLARGGTSQCQGPGSHSPLFNDSVPLPFR